MSGRSTDALIEELAREAGPVTPLASPLRRALSTLAALGIGGAALVLLGGDFDGLLARYGDRPAMMWLEMAAMLLTALLAVVGAFFVAVPGRSRRWLLAPLAPFAAWLALSGLGCVRDLGRPGPGIWAWGHSTDCLTFIVGASLIVGGPLLWRLSRARPIDPLPVALLGGLGAAALSALLLQFFHPFALTVVDLAVHFGAVLLVMLLAALARRLALRPA